MSQECIQPKQSINIRLFKSDSHINGWNNGFYSIFRLNENVDSVYQGSFTGLGLVQTDVHCLDHADYIVSLSQPTAGNKLEIGLEVCDKAFVNVGQAVAISIGGSIGCEVMDKRSEYTIASDKQAHIGAINELLGASVTLGGSASDTLDTYSQQAVVNAQAAATNINPKFITFFKSVVISTQRRLIEKNTNIDAVDYFFHKLDSLFQPHRQLVSYNLAVFTNTTIPLIGDYESFQNSPESLYSNIVGNLTESVVSNSFTSILKDASTQLGATQLINSVANNISASAIKVSPPQTLSPTSLPTFRPTHSPTDNYLSSGDISAAVIMSIFGAALIIFGIYYWFIYSGKNANKSDDNFHNPFDEQAGVEVRDATVANNDNQPTRNSYTL
eukprot:gene20232-26267_t